MTISKATSHPSIACGPPNAVMSNGMVMNGPTPIMFVMLSAVACSMPKRRGNGAGEFMREGMYHGCQGCHVCQVCLECERCHGCGRRAISLDTVESPRLNSAARAGAFSRC